MILPMRVCTRYSKAKAEISEVGPDDMYNPWYNILAKEGKGTLFYNGSWNLFDQIVLSPSLLNKDSKNKDYSSLKYLEAPRIPSEII